MLKLQKRIQNDNLYFVIIDIQNGCFRDMFYVSKDKEFPVLSEYIFKIMLETLDSLFKDKPYNQKEYYDNLLIFHKLCFKNSNVMLDTVVPINNLTTSIKYGCLSNIITILQKKISVDGVEKLKSIIYNTDFYGELSIQEKDMLEKAKDVICPKKDSKILLKEAVKTIIEPICAEQIYNLKNKIKVKQ